jgi:hypothetical protein
MNNCEPDAQNTGILLHMFTACSFCLLFLQSLMLKKAPDIWVVLCTGEKRAKVGL